MAGSRRYKLLCPISRALDRVGDRWSLLILRDLHAGPARFTDLQTGLSGIAANLLTDRLRQLVEDGIIEKQAGDHGVALYALTDLGTQTQTLLFELAMFGGRFRPDTEPRKPGNLRTIVVTLKSALQKVVSPGIHLNAEIRVDSEPFALSIDNGAVDLVSGKSGKPDVIMTTAYEAMLAASEGEMPMDEFVTKHVHLETRTAGKDNDLMMLLGKTMEIFHNDG